MNSISRLLGGLVLWLITSFACAAPIGSAFHFSGELRDQGVPVSGLYTFEVGLYLQSSGGTAIAVQTVNDRQVDEGLFNLVLDFTSVPFEAREVYWLETRVRPSIGPTPFETLLPRTSIRPVPYAFESTRAQAALTAGIASTVSPGAIGATEIDGATVQRRVLSTCPTGQSIRAIGESGSVTCEADDVGSGTVTDVTATGGLQRTGTAAVPNLSIATEGVQSGMLAPGSVGAAAINASEVQRRVAGSCAPANYIRSISTDGSVVCEPVNPPPPPPPAIGQNERRQISAVAPFAAAMGTTGLPILVGKQSPYDPYLVTILCQDASCTSYGYTPFTSESAPGSGERTQIAMAVSPAGYVSFVRGIDQLKFWRCANLNCGLQAVTSGITLNSVSGSYATAMLVAPDGLPLIAYIGPTDNLLKTIKCNSVDCAGAVTSTLSADAVSIGIRGVAIARRASANPGIAFVGRQLDASPKALFVRCSDLNCTSTTGAAVEYATGGVGVTPDLVIPNDDRPIISHFSQDSLDLLVTRCGDATCSAGNITTTVSSAGSVGFGAEIGLIDGLPVVSYLDVTNTRVMVVRCGNLECSSDNTFGVVRDEEVTYDGTALLIDPSGRPNVVVGNQGSLIFNRCANVACN